MIGISEFRRAAPILLLAVSVCGAAGVAPVKADTASNSVQLPTAAELAASLRAVEILFDANKKMAALVQTIPASDKSPDFRGRTRAQDWQDYMFKADLLATVDEKERQTLDFIAQDKRREAQIEIYQLRKLLKDEALLGDAIDDYWKLLGNRPPDYSPYIAMLRVSGIEPAYSANVESLERTFATEISHGLFVSAMKNSYAKIAAFYRQAAIEGAESLQKLNFPTALGRLYPQASDNECSPAAAQTSGTDKVNVDPSRPSSSVEYPRDSRMLREEGVVIVGFVVTKFGCVRLASVYGSSGYERLDRAAVAHLLAVRYLPAELNGEPIEQSGMIEIKFKLGEQP